MRLRCYRKRIFGLLLLSVCVAVAFWSINSFELVDGDELDSKSRLASRRHVINRKLRSEKSNALSKERETSEVTDENRTYSHKTHPWMFPRPLSELENNSVPNNVFFVWCDNRTFTFNDFLSVLSAWKFLEPDMLEIHRGTDLSTDKYNQWFLELNRTIPAFEVKTIPARQGGILCGNPLVYALDLLRDRGGIYVSFSTVLLRSIHFVRKQNFSVAFSEGGTVAFISGQTRCRQLDRILSNAYTEEPSDLVALLQESETESTVCPSVFESLPLNVQKEGAQKRPQCVTVTSIRLSPLTLRRIRNRDLFTLRDLYYVDLGTGELCPPAEGRKQHHNVPFIVHYVWFGDSEFSFRMYLSFLSTVHVAKADRVFIHTDLYLRGVYWKTVSAHPKVTVVYREAPLRIFGHQILYTQHRSDIVRADVLDKFGGIYMDWDVLWLSSPEPLLRLPSGGHGAVVNLDHMAMPPFREVFNLGVFLASPRSRFVRLWRSELRHYRSHDFLYNALELPYKVYERHPETVLVEKRLQVMCFYLKCHPIFHPDYRDWQKAQPFNWRTDAYSIHFTHPDPEEFSSVVSLVNGSGTFADIGMYILEQARELEVD